MKARIVAAEGKEKKRRVSVGKGYRDKYGGFSVAPMRQASAKRKTVRLRSQPHDLDRMLWWTVQPSEGVRYPIRARHTHNGRRKEPDLRSGE